MAPNVPVNLLGRDLLMKLEATILCGPNELTVTFSDGAVALYAGGHHSYGQWLMKSLDNHALLTSTG